MVFITATESKLGQLAGFQEDATGQGLQKHWNSGAKETASCLNVLVNHFHGFLLVLGQSGMESRGGEEEEGGEGGGGRESQSKGKRLCLRTFISPAFQFPVFMDWYSFL